MAASTPAWLTRRQAAALLGQSEAQVRAEDGKSLNPQKGPDGSWRYPPEEVAALLRGTSELSTAEPNGAVCAAAFELFTQKKALTDVVIEIKQPPSRVRCLRSEFDAMSRSLTVSDIGVATLEKLLRTPIQEEQQLVNAVTTLVERLRGEYQRGYRDGTEEAHDLGEIVDESTGKRRALRPEDMPAVARAAEMQWGRSKAGSAACRCPTGPAQEAQTEGNASNKETQDDHPRE